MANLIEKLAESNELFWAEKELNKQVAQEKQVAVEE